MCHLQGKLRTNFLQSPVSFPPKPGIVSPKARYASLGARYLFPHYPVSKALSYRALREERMKRSNLPRKPGIQRVAKYHETLDYRLKYYPEAKGCGALLSRKLHHIPPIPSIQAAEDATNVPLESRIRGTQRLDNSKGDAALHCLSFSAQWGGA